MNIPLYVVDAFTDAAFSGNPAAICPLDDWLDDDLMQAIAAENNLSETAFFVPAGDTFALRWFTPKVEVDLCGHATLASAFVLSLTGKGGSLPYRFDTKSGELQVTERDQWFTLDFPARDIEPLDNEDAIIAQVEAACGKRPLAAVRAANTCIAEFADETALRSFTPNFAKVAAMDFHGLVVTARGENHDFVSRFFAPKVGIDEDPVTGSIHCGLIPYWHRKTGKAEMTAFQASPRGGALRCRYAGERVEIGGQAVLFSQGEITL